MEWLEDQEAYLYEFEDRDGRPSDGNHFMKEATSQGLQAIWGEVGRDNGRTEWGIAE